MLKHFSFGFPSCSLNIRAVSGHAPCCRLVVYAQPSSGRDDVIAFVTGNTADYKRSDPIAEMAIKWAQERREKIEVSMNISS